MRSRYAAYVTSKLDYLVETTHPSARGPDLRSAYQATFESIQWIGLEVLSCFQGGERDKTGKVEFEATYLQGGRRGIHHELSRFKRHRGQWHYLDGIISEKCIG